jgi:uncharacterized protein YndB with AHSA1/START domain
MTVRIDDSVPVRSVEVEIEVPGTPEEVWRAIATGPGWSAWFAPTEVEEREGGAVKCSMGPGMESTAVVTAWQPPHRFATEDRTSWMPGAPPLATEIFVEAKAGGLCRVRLVNSLFTSQADWDDQLEGMEKGWPLFFEVLYLYLTHFRGARSAPAAAVAVTSSSEAEAWPALLDALGLTGATAGERRTIGALGAPQLAIAVEKMRSNGAVLRLVEPAPGLAVIGAGDCGPMGVMVSANLYFYGDGGAAAAEREGSRWQAWLAERFPAPAPPDAPADEAVEAAR